MTMNNRSITYILEIPQEKLNEATRALQGIAGHFQPGDNIVLIENIEKEPTSLIFHGNDLWEIITNINETLAEEEIKPFLQDPRDNWTPGETQDVLQLARDNFSWPDGTSGPPNWKGTQEDWDAAVTQNPRLFPEGSNRKRKGQ